MNNLSMAWRYLLFLPLMALVSITALQAQLPTKITNRWTGENLGLSAGVPYISTAATDTWVFEPTGEADFFRIKHVESGTYLHMPVQGKLKAAGIQPGWWDAMWSVKSVDGHVQIVNRHFATYLHNQKKTLEVGALGAPGWWSAQWKIQFLPPNLPPLANLVGPSITPGKYYRIQLKTSAAYHLRVWNTGLIGSSKEDKPDAFSEWLFVPTGDEVDTYWIFNKGARDGRGQIMAIPPARTNYNQWDFVPTDTRQKFKLQGAGNGYYRIISKATNKAVSTRWNEMAFEWNVTTNDDQQLFKLVEMGNIDDKDVLPGYVYWNHDSKQLKKYFKEFCKKIPNPQLLNIKEFVFYNASSQTVAPAVHRFGCAGAPWRDGKAQCGWSSLAPGADWTFELNDYLKNAEQIWTIIGWTGAIVAAVAVTVVTAGAAAPAVSSLLGTAGTTTAGAVLSIQLGAQIATTVLTIVDFAIISPGIVNILNNAVEVSKSDEVSTNITAATFMKANGLDKKTILYLDQKLGGEYFYAGEKLYSAFFNGFYLEETKTQTKIDKVFYANGKCVFVISDETLKK